MDSPGSTEDQARPRVPASPENSALSTSGSARSSTTECQDNVELEPRMDPQSLPRISTDSDHDLWKLATPGPTPIKDGFHIHEQNDASLATTTTTITSPAEDALTTAQQADILTPSPSTSPASSVRAPSPLSFANFPDRLGLREAGIATHFRLAQPFTRTRQTMRTITGKLSIIASRGYPRTDHAPTRPTKPSLRHRRYSVDVLTRNWDSDSRHGWKQEFPEHRMPMMSWQMEPVLIPAPVLPVPYPARYAAFGLESAMNPPLNDEPYLDFGDASITNADFLYMGVTDWRVSSEVWMRDSSLNMAMQVLRRDEDCDSHGIGIANANTAQVVRFACGSQDGSGREYDPYRELYHDKRWIFVVINDAYGGESNEGINGSHWSLVAINRVRRRVHYIDSLDVAHPSRRDNGFQVAEGLLLILDGVVERYDFRPEWHSPNQVIHNQGIDGGACGPFIYAMIEMMIHTIKTYQQYGREDQCRLDLDYNFPYVFRENFHSHFVRYNMKRRIARWKAMVDAALYTNYHDEIALRGEPVEIVDGPAPDVQLPPQPFRNAGRDPKRTPPSRKRFAHQRQSRSPDSDRYRHHYSDAESDNSSMRIVDVSDGERSGSAKSIRVNESDVEEEMLLDGADYQQQGYEGQVQDSTNDQPLDSDDTLSVMNNAVEEPVEIPDTPGASEAEDGDEDEDDADLPEEWLN